MLRLSSQTFIIHLGALLNRLDVEAATRHLTRRGFALRRIARPDEDAHAILRELSADLTADAAVFRL